MKKVKTTKSQTAKASQAGRPASQAAKPAHQSPKFGKLGKLASLVGLGPKKTSASHSAKKSTPAATKAGPHAGQSVSKSKGVKEKITHEKNAKEKISAASKKVPQPAASKKTAAPAKVAAPKAAGAKAAQSAVAAHVPAVTSAAVPAKKGGKRKPVLSAPQLALASATANIRASRNGGARAREESSEVCREVACEGLSTTAGYCRMHYVKNWKKIKRKEVILKEGKLNQYIEELVVKYPDKYIEAIRQDLASDKDFAKVIYDLDLDEGVDEFDPEGESLEAVIDTIKRDFDDEGDTGF
jgi:hypothetical protein